jgi:inorganic pyrophosphatase/exopolyphosphatase
VLVDHNELAQAVPGAGDMPIVEILDHHRLGNMPTVTAARKSASSVSCGLPVSTRQPVSAA